MLIKPRSVPSRSTVFNRLPVSPLIGSALVMGFGLLMGTCLIWVAAEELIRLGLKMHVERRGGFVMARRLTSPHLGGRRQLALFLGVTGRAPG